MFGPPKVAEENRTALSNFNVWTKRMRIENCTTCITPGQPRLSETTRTLGVKQLSGLCFGEPGPVRINELPVAGDENPISNSFKEGAPFAPNAKGQGTLQIGVSG
jgi:hypothetical protein